MGCHGDFFVVTRTIPYTDIEKRGGDYDRVSFKKMI